MVLAVDLEKPVQGHQIVDAFRKLVPEEARKEKSDGGSMRLGKSSGINMVWDITVMVGQSYDQLGLTLGVDPDYMEILAYQSYKAIALANCNLGGMKHDLTVGDPTARLFEDMNKLKAGLEKELNKS